MFLRSFLMTVLLFFASNVCFGKNDLFFKALQKQESIMQPCTCDCHKRIYSHKECKICTHYGGKFFITQTHIHIETQKEEGKNHD